MNDKTTYQAAVQDRIYAHCSNAIAEAGRERESLFLARLALLLFEQVRDEQQCLEAIDAALNELPTPSLSAG
ncbi:hypothetical protein [Verminephrobacter eiseniae]|uniref:hypothetical protein n=1 Tax=Verminephrobacter eiseniae TaxID=364317 RepID=UPI00031A9166|nr:hypothetical protein [Verminephrobacter eiseniae]KAB7591459.1 hypothetical protein ET532_014275 [Verminephrobacter sp. Larva24]MCW5230216.1 hypothetical protein [Verminephrobacter eiseniae]MCW5260556.1 hypothetical protein [Verminephrobacter eiseniae]MCW5285815.1 hypothetical protein [Verminephrobacter eiseniae]MCW5291949.1 hypothetical protein [Verminephrobacter eiseniae]